MFTYILKQYIERLGPGETAEMRQKRALINKAEDDFHILRDQVGAYIDSIQKAINEIEDTERPSAILGQSLLLIVLYEELELPEFYEEAVEDAYLYANNMIQQDNIYLEVRNILERRG